MIAILAGFLATVLAGLFGLHDAAGGANEGAGRSAKESAPSGPVAACAAVVALAFLAQIAVVAYAAHAQLPVQPWFSKLPILAIDDGWPLFAHAPGGPAALCCALAETAACAGLLRAAGTARLTATAWSAVAGAALLMTAAAIAAPVATSFDMYAYAAAAHAPDPYRAPATLFGGEASIFNAVARGRIAPSPYGPVWNELARAVTAPFATVGAQLVALRCLGALALGVCALALRALRASDAAVALVALNPGLIGSFVLDAHNDLIGVAFVLASMALYGRSRIAAAALAILAGGTKLPLLAVAALCGVGARGRAERLGAAAVAVTGGLILSALCGGEAYLQALHTTSYAYRDALRDPLRDALHLALALSALCAVGGAIVARRAWPTAAFAFVAPAVSVFGWYVAWGLPYAVFERRALGVFLVAQPLLTFSLATVYAPSFAESAALRTLILGAPLATYVLLRGRRGEAAMRWVRAGRRA